MNFNSPRDVKQEFDRREIFKRKDTPLWNGNVSVLMLVVYFVEGWDGIWSTFMSAIQRLRVTRFKLTCITHSSRIPGQAAAISVRIFVSSLHK